MPDPDPQRPHLLWLGNWRYRLCFCPLAGEHNKSAWRSVHALAEVGLTVGPGKLTPYTLCQSCGAFEHAHGRCPHA
jgi:hypothetical protein